MMKALRRAVWTLASVMFATAVQQVAAAPILLRAERIDVGSKTSSALAAVRMTSAAMSSTASTAAQEVLTGTKFIIQHDGIITPEWRASLEKAGAKIMGYVPENAYLVSVTNGGIARVSSDVPHTALLPYRKQHRIDSGISANNAVLKAISVQATTSNRVSFVKMYVVSLFSSEFRSAYVEKINAFPNCRVLQSQGKIIHALLDASGVQSVAGLDEVRYVSVWVQPKLHNNVAVQEPRMNVETVWPGGATELGLTGKGQVVAIADTGLDTGDMATLHEDVRGRVLKAYPLSSLWDGGIVRFMVDDVTYGFNARNTWDDPDGHGTHVTGSVLGNGNKSSSLIRGAAYEAQLIFQSTMQTGLDNVWPSPDLESLFLQTYTNQLGSAGARIHSNSWGGDVYGKYTENSEAVDSFVFSHPDMLIVISAGNAGADTNKTDGVIDSGSVGSPATAKNCVAVGASENYRATGGYAARYWGTGSWLVKYPVNPIKTDYISRPDDGTHQGMAAFSSRGPCEDGRIKPDIVAPGTDILSLRSSVGEESWGSYNDYYQYNGGTSMSAPLVSGAATLARQWLVEKKGIANPDGATIKALLSAGAKSLYPGQYKTVEEIPDSYPNNVEGWGQVNLGNALVNEKGLVVHDGKIIQHGETQIYRFNVASLGSGLTLVMAYADAPGSPANEKQLVDDLDMLVVSPSGRPFYPNCQCGPDHTNNVEGVRLAAADVEVGDYTVTITGTNINTPMDTAWTDGKLNAIRYSLVANGATAVEVAAAASAQVTAATLKPRWPWNGKVDIDYTVAIVPANASANISVCGIDEDRQRTLAAKTLSGITNAPATGSYRVTWDIAADYPNLNATSFKVKVEPTVIAPKVTLALDLQGGSGSTSVSATYGEVLPSITPPTRTGHLFGGYYETNDFTDNPWYANDGTGVRTWHGTSTVKLYAKWTPIAYKVTFNSNGGTGGSMSEQVFTYDVAQNLTVNGFAKTGYTFEGWATEASGPVVYGDGRNVKNLSSVNGSSVPLFAKWTANTYQVTLDQQDGNGGTPSVTATYDSELPAVTIPTRNGYTFGGYFTLPEAAGTQYYRFDGESARIWDMTEPKTLYARWVPNSSFGFVRDEDMEKYTVLDAWPCAFYLGATDDFDSEEVQCFTPGTTVYLHVAWQNIGLNTISNPVVKIETLNTDMTQAATPTFVTLTSKKASGSVAAFIFTRSAIANLKHGSYILRLTLDPDNLIEDVDRSDNVITYSFNVNATGVKYTVTFDQQSGSGGSTSITATFGSGMPTITLPTRTGYVFGGYYSAANGGGDQYYAADGSSVRTWDKDAATKLYAKWTAITYTVTFNKNRGSGTTMSAQSFTYDVAQNLTANSYSRSGYTFAGWATNSTGSVLYADKKSVKNLTTTQDATVALYAIWTPIIYKISFNANGGAGTMAQQTITYGQSGQNLAASKFSKTGYVFAGWSTSSSGTVSYTDKTSSANTLTTTEGAIVTLYAVWGMEITLDKQGGSGGTDSVACQVKGSSMQSVSAPSKSGYIFGGYYSQAEGAGTQYYSASGAGVRNWDQTAKATLYAKWIPTMIVVDLSGGTTATSYPVSSLAAIPDGGWTEEYATTKLVLQRVEAGTFKMQGSKTTTITRPFYMGVFAISKKQWLSVMNYNPRDLSTDSIKYGMWYDQQPVEYVSYNKIRGISDGAKWPSSDAVDATSFLGTLRAKTGLDFDLPTEAQWEYACRAGTTTTYYWGSSMDGDYACYTENASSHQTCYVYSKKPNAWGFYNMSGNVWEWCRDWYGGTLSYGNDPTGPTSGTYRVTRGGSWRTKADCCESSYRNNTTPSAGYSGFGFRVMVELSE